MVRKDKIAYILTYCNSFGRTYQYPNDSIYHCILKTILSQNTSDLNRDRAYESLLDTFGDLGDIIKSDVSDVERSIKIGGLAKQKARTIKLFCEWCADRFGSDNMTEIVGWSDEKIISELTQIKGIGLKTVCIVMCFVLERDILPIDVHVNRILSRIGVVDSQRSPDKMFYSVSPMVPVGKHYYMHMNLIDFGRSTCSARSPKCSRCEIRVHCDYNNKKNYWMNV